MGKKSTNIPPPDPRLYASLDKQIAQGDRMLDFVQKSYAENSVRQDKQDALNEQAITQQMRLADQAEGRANDAYSFYQTKGRPVIEQTLEDAKGWDSQGNLDQARGRASSDVAQGFDNAEAQGARAMSRMGINPSSGRFMALNNRLQAEKAMNMAGAMTGAEDTRRMQGVQMRQQAGNIAQGMPAQAMNFAGQASGMGAGAAGLGAAGMQGAMSIQNQAIGGMGGAANIYGSGASGYNSAYGNQLQAAQIQNQANQSSMGGFGQLLGMGASLMKFADGGPVHGPGSGTSDSVPAVNQDSGQPIRLSNGEYVISADVVRAKGREFFDKLQAKHHTPVGNLRRAS